MYSKLDLNRSQVNTFTEDKCMREHLQVQENTFAEGKCVREHLQVQDIEDLKKSRVLISKSMYEIKK